MEALASQPVGPVVLLANPSQSVVSELLHAEPSQSVVSGLVVISRPSVLTVLNLGMPILTSPRESVLLDDSSSPVYLVDSLVSSGNW